MMTHTVIGVFPTNTQASDARQALLRAGYAADDIDLNTYGENGRPGADFAADHRADLAEWFGELFDIDERESNRYADVAGGGTVLTFYTDSLPDAERAGTLIDEFGTIALDEDC